MVRSIPGSFVHMDVGLRHWMKLRHHVVSFFLNPRISSTTRRKSLMKDGSGSFRMSGYILQNNLVFFFYLLLNKLDVHGKQFVGILVFVFGMRFPTYGSTQHLQKRTEDRNLFTALHHYKCKKTSGQRA